MIYKDRSANMVVFLGAKTVNVGTCLGQMYQGMPFMQLADNPAGDEDEPSFVHIVFANTAALDVLRRAADSLEELLKEMSNRDALLDAEYGKPI